MFSLHTLSLYRKKKNFTFIEISKVLSNGDNFSSLITSPVTRHCISSFFTPQLTSYSEEKHQKKHSIN